MTDSKTPFRVLRKELCSCVTMQFPKCKLCDAQGFFAVVDWQATADALERELTAEREKSARLEKDAARLDWLDRIGKESGCGFDHTGYGDYRYYALRWYGGAEYPLARQVIDAALKGECNG